jgi:LIM domain
MKNPTAPNVSANSSQSAALPAPNPSPVQTCWLKTVSRLSHCVVSTGIGGTRFISFEDRHWHNDCFQCASCNATLVGKGFITDGADILCPECAKQRVL